MITHRALAIPVIALVAITCLLLLSSPREVRSLDETFSDPAGDSVFIYLDGEPPAPACAGDITSVQVQSDAALIRFIITRPDEFASPWSDEVKIWLDPDSFLLFKDEDGSLIETFTWNGGAASGLNVEQPDSATMIFEIPASYAPAITSFYVLSFHQTDEADPDARCGDETATFTVDLTIPPTETPTTEPTATPTTEPTSEPTAEPTTEPTSVPTSEPTATPTSTTAPASTAVPTSTVAAATQAPAPPSTGSGARGAGSLSPLTLALGGVMIAIGGAALVVSLRRT